MRREEFELIMMDSHLPYEAKLLYSYLRYHMNYKTAVVGNKRKISYTSIREHLEYIPPKCSTERPVSVSLKRARNLIAKLESIGAIVPMHDKNSRQSMVFQLPLALSKQICPNEEGHMRGIAGARENSGSSELIHKDEGHTSSYLVTTTKTNNINLREADFSGGLISPSWIPSQEVIQRLGDEFGLPVDFLEQYAFEFRVYWRERSGEASSWDLKFYNHVCGRVRDRAGRFLEAMRPAGPRH